MKEDQDYFRENPGRRNPSPGIQVYSGQLTIVYLTVKTLGRKPWLATDDTHELIREAWREANAWLVSDYVLMPDHLHLFCTPGEQEIEIETWISFGSEDSD